METLEAVLQTAETRARLRAFDAEATANGCEWICDNGAVFIASLLGHNVAKLPTVELPTVDDFLLLVTTAEGAFHIVIDHAAEYHAFILWLSSDRLTVYNTYGGTAEFFVNHTSRDDWLALFALVSQPQTADTWPELYAALWGFRPQMVRKANVKNMVYQSGAACRLHD